MGGVGGPPPFECYLLLWTTATPTKTPGQGGNQKTEMAASKARGVLVPNWPYLGPATEFGENQTTGRNGFNLGAQIFCLTLCL